MGLNDHLEPSLEAARGGPKIKPKIKMRRSRGVPPAATGRAGSWRAPALQGRCSRSRQSQVGGTGL